MSFSILPDSLVLEIFNWLTFAQRCRISRTCKQFYRITKDPSYLRKLDLTGLYKHMNVRKLKKIVTRHCTEHLLELTLKGNYQSWEVNTITVAALQSIKKRAPNLQALTLHTHCLKRFTIVSFDLFPLKLKYLSLRGSMFHASDLFGHPKSQESLPELTTLDLGKCTVVSSSDLSNFKNWTSLRILFLDMCYRINTGGLEWMLDILPLLVCLDLENTSISNEAVALLFSHCQNIQYLYLGGNYLDNEGFTRRNSSPLQHLIKICLIGTLVTTDIVKILKSRHPKLQTVVMGKSNVLGIKKSCKHYLDHIPRITI